MSRPPRRGSSGRVSLLRLPCERPAYGSPCWQKDRMGRYRHQTSLGSERDRRPRTARAGISSKQSDTRTLERRNGHLRAVIPAFVAGSRSGRPDVRSAGTRLYHGTWWDRHQQEQDSLETLKAGRFTTLLPHLSPAVFELADLRLLADEMTSRQDRRPAHE